MTNILDNINNLMQITENRLDLVKHALLGTGLIAGTAGTGAFLSNLETDLTKSKNTLSNDLDTLKTNIYSGAGGAAAGATAALGIGAIGKSLYRKPKQHPIEESAGAAVADAATDAAGKVFSLGNIAKALGGASLAGGGVAAGYGVSDFFNKKSIDRSHIENELKRYNSNVDVGVKAAGAGAAGAIGLGLLGRQLSKSSDLRSRSRQEDLTR